jgi:hypothetical protein
MMVIVEQLVEWRMEWETEVLGENLSQCHFVHHKSYVTWPVLEPGPPRWKTATNRLSYGVAKVLVLSELLQLITHNAVQQVSQGILEILGRILRVSMCFRCTENLLGVPENAY